MARLTRGLCLRKRGAAAKPTFIRMLAHVFNEDIVELKTVLMSVGMHRRRFAANFSSPKEAGQVPLPEFPRTREWLQNDEVTLTGVGENWLAG